MREYNSSLSQLRKDSSMKRLFVPLTAVFAAGVLAFSGCNKEEEKPMEEQPAVVDSMKAPTNVDSLVIDTAGTGTEVVVTDGDSAKAASKPKSTKTQTTKPKVEVEGNTGTRRPQRDVNTGNDGGDIKLEPNKNTNESNTTTKRPQRP